MSNRLTVVIALLALSCFWATASFYRSHIGKRVEAHAAISIASPVQVLLYGGDRFLAADIEAIRAAAATTDKQAHQFQLNAHLTVSRLNPCHEDNYWFGNASLSWGGAVDQGFEVLDNAMHCRFWDEWPAFFYGFNESFFKKNIDSARKALEIAAQRSSKNAAAFRNFSIMLAAGQIEDTRAALNMLQHEHDTTDDPALRRMLSKRITRLEGLLILRKAQSLYESKFKRPLTRPEELLEHGILEGFPRDPLGIGYVFKDNEFQLKNLKIQ